ncbi:single-stranded DNA-binding protein [Chitinophaga barathri]|uniref:Single-stranded DNA-binding protein n=1 Tax=Chitinophaga barathri TaxID=1647451 RepID=A0A3N4MSA4_9BACT|nr:single-stranded DNA-binding protein [Chitinophaga barathri]RPD42429.1 single-stranded DNA-binding protein [Chitinophaga barathri]
MIKLSLIGHLGQDAILNTVNDKKVLNFSVAHNERFKNAAGEVQERTIWANCALWAPNAVGPYLLQGTYVYVEGTPYIEMYTDKKGQPAVSLKLRVTNVQLLASSQRSADKAGDGKETTEPDQPIDDLPF